MIYESTRVKELTPYTPGEQPRDKKYIKLNTNESPFPPPDEVVSAATEAARDLRLYSDPDSYDLRKKMSEAYGIPPSRILMTNGSDEALFFAFTAFADRSCPLAFADITYGFYRVAAVACGVPYTLVPLREGLKLCADDYIGIGKTVVIANPNAPTGTYLTPDEIERIAAGNPDNAVIIDEAYIDFGGESAARLTGRYDNLLVVGTFSKSRSLAGARLGFAFGSEKIISVLNTVKSSINPYNINRMTSAAGIAALGQKAYYEKNCREIMRVREITEALLKRLDFEVISSMANFLFAKSRRIGGKELYLLLKQKGILVRHFDTEGISDYVRITVGTEEDMQALSKTIETIYKEIKK